MALPSDYTDREFKAFKENPTDGGVDRRTCDQITHAKLDSVISALGGDFTDQAKILDQGLVVIGTTAVHLKVGAADAVGREFYILENKSNNDIFVGTASVTTAIGIRIRKGAKAVIPSIEGFPLYGIAASAGNNLSVSEFGN